uniref:RNA-directed DNA methylation 4 n=1 Tax=Panagrellus redivivus TaxID=6233 RepID=A0A7E4W277_PANRE
MNTNNVFVNSATNVALIEFELRKARFAQQLALSQRNHKLASQVGTGNDVDEVRSEYAFDMGTSENDLIGCQSGTESGIASDDNCDKHSVYAFDVDDADEVKSVSKDDVVVDSDDDEDKSDFEDDFNGDVIEDLESEYAFDFYGSDVESDYAMYWYTDDECLGWSSDDDDEEDEDDEEDDDVDDGASEYAFDKNADDGVGEPDDNAGDYGSEEHSSDEDEDYADDDKSIVSDYAFDFYGSDGVESEYA